MSCAEGVKETIQEVVAEPFLKNYQSYLLTVALGVFLGASLKITKTLITNSNPRSTLLNALAPFTVISSFLASKSLLEE